MTGPTASSGACSDEFSSSRCDLLVGLDGLHVTAVEEVIGRHGPFLRGRVQSRARVQGCRVCGVVMRSHDRRDVRLIGTPCFGPPVELTWRKRTWRCAELSCPGDVVTEQDEAIAAWLLSLERHGSTGSATSGSSTSLLGVFEQTARALGVGPCRSTCLRWRPACRRTGWPASRPINQ